VKRKESPDERVLRRTRAFIQRTYEDPALLERLYEKLEAIRKGSAK